MKASQKCIDLIKQFEGFSSKPYLCPAGKATIGYGSTFYEDGKPVTMQDAPISEERAKDIVFTVLYKNFEPFVNNMVTVQITQNQYDALIDFAYNCGVGNLKTSTLMRKLNAGDKTGAADEFLRWNKGGGKVLAGLTKRREAERALFLA
jgi:GH24 family phage-related lysozyme (muramidase)